MAMRLSRIGYFADFVVYPMLLAALSWGTLRHARTLQREDWMLAFGAGLCCWTLLEYALHRYVLHHAPPFRRMHALHHASPAALIGTPSWLSVSLIGGLVFVPLLHELQVDVASGATAGLMLGYLWYVGVHHAAHHRRARPGSYLYRAKQRHALHHHSPRACNFGVTTALWDIVFGSARSPAS
jgi:sterol desaturase/sphingolipid hydroxylase (fatty acid hydroxylase superfamily)